MAGEEPRTVWPQFLTTAEITFGCPHVSCSRGIWQKGLIFRIHWKEMKISLLIKASAGELWVTGLLTRSSWAASQAHQQLESGATWDRIVPLSQVFMERLMPCFCPGYQHRSVWKDHQVDLQNDLKGLKLVVFLHVGVPFLLFLAGGLPWENRNWALEVSGYLLVYLLFPGLNQSI